MSINNYPSTAYKDPLTAIEVYNFSSAKMRELVVDGDYLLNIYIHQLDNEIFSNQPKGLTISEEIGWDTELWTRITDALRIHGWVFVIELDDEWMVFSESQRVQWMPNKEPTGVEVQWTDTFLNVRKETYQFTDGFFWIWDKRNGAIWQDLNQAQWTLAAELRNVRNQIAIIGSKPGFKHFVLGDGYENATAAQKTTVEEAIMYADTNNGFASTKDLVEEVRNIESGDMSALIPSYDKLMESFAASCRLPSVFFSSKTESGNGLSAVGAQVEDVRVLRKKDYIFQHMEPFLKEFYEIGDNVELEMGEEYTVEEVVEKSQGDLSNGQ
jgi:hypothetical protein